jgi:Uncharacterized protein conserved in bacteria (DUF2188)
MGTTKKSRTAKTTEKKPRRIEVAPQKGWEVIDSGRKGAAGRRAFPTREAAIAEAAKLAGLNRPSELVIRRTDGSIQIERKFDKS